MFFCNKLSMYGSLCVIVAIAACIYAADYRAHRRAVSQGARPWPWQGYYLLFMLAGFVSSALKLAFYCAYKWQQKAPDLIAAPKSSSLACSLNANAWTM